MLVCSTTVDSQKQMQVNGAILVPASAMVEMGAAAAAVLSDAAVPLLANLNIAAPMMLPSPASPAVATVSVSQAGQADILSEAAGTRQVSRLHCSCSVRRMPLQPSGNFTLQSVPCHCLQPEYVLCKAPDILADTC